MGGERFRGKLTKQQLDMCVRFQGTRSRKVKDYLAMYYVSGVIICDIASYTGSDIGNIHRDVTKIARVLNFIELFNEYEECKKWVR